MKAVFQVLFGLALCVSQGLIYPQKSIPFNKIANGTKVTALTEGALAYVDGAMLQGLIAESASAVDGTCH